MSAFVVSNIATDLKMLSNDQRFIFGNNTLPEPLAAFKIDNIFTPVVGTPSVTNFETRNNTLSGFRWVHTTNSGDTFGSLKLQSFVNAQSTGNDILLFNSDGSVVINNLNVPSLDVNSPFNINYTAPLTALYLKGPSFTEAGFVYSNSLLETILFSATDLRISSTSGQIHFSLDSGTNDFITFNNQGFKSIVNFIANNPDTSGFIPEKGLILQTEGTTRGAVTFDHVDNQMKIYTSGNDPILFGVNSINAMQILTSGNIDLLNHRITNAANPVNAQDYVTKAFAESLQLVIPNLVNVNGATQTFLYSLEHITSFIAKNNTAPTSGNPSSISFDLINNTNTGYRFKHQITDTDLTGNLKLLHFNNFGETLFLTASFSAFSVPQVTINGGFIVTGNSTLQYTAFNGDAVFNQGCFVLTPVFDGQAANKLYVDDSISNFTTSNPITLTGAVTGINSIDNPIFTTFASTIPVSGANQIFNFSLNSNVVYRLNNTLAATTGTPSTIALSLNNATNGGYRLLHTSTSTDVTGLGTLNLQAINSVGGNIDVFTASINSGIPDLTINGTATLSLGRTKGTIGGSKFEIYGTVNSTSGGPNIQTVTSQDNYPNLQILPYSHDNVAITFDAYYDGAWKSGFIGSNFQIYKISSQIQFNYASGVSQGNTLTWTTALTINTSGNIGIGGNTSPNAPLQFGNAVVNRKIVLYETANNNNQFFGFGINGGILRYQVDLTGSDHVFYAGTSSTTSNELFRIKGNGDTITAGTIFGRRVSGLMTMQGNAVGTTITTGGTYYKVAGTTVSSNLNGLFSAVSNRLTHTVTNSAIAYVNVSFTASHNGAAGEETTFALYKNGSQLTNTLISGQNLNTLGVLSINTLVSMSTNDYIELWCTNPNNGRIITVKHLMFNYTTT